MSTADADTGKNLVTRWDRLARTPLPGIAALRDGSFVLLGKTSTDKILVQPPDCSRPTLMTRATLYRLQAGLHEVR